MTWCYPIKTLPQLDALPRADIVVFKPPQHMRFSFLSILRQPVIYQIIDAFRRIQDVSRMNYVFIAMQTCPKSLPNLVERIADFTIIPPVQVLLETPRCCFQWITGWENSSSWMLSIRRSFLDEAFIKESYSSVAQLLLLRSEPRNAGSLA